MPRALMNAFNNMGMLGKGVTIYAVAAAIGEITGKYSLIPFLGSGQPFFDKHIPKSSSLAKSVMDDKYQTYQPFSDNIKQYIAGRGGFRLSALPDPTTAKLTDELADRGVIDWNKPWGSQEKVGLIRSIINRLVY